MADGACGACGCSAWTEVGRGERSHEMSDVEAQGGGKQEKETPGDGQPERREASARSGVRKPRGVASLERRAAADKRGRPSRISSHTVLVL